MAKTIDFCSDCGKVTEHVVVKRDTGALERAFFGIFTLGFSEMLPDGAWAKCSNCGSLQRVVVNR